MIYLIDDDNSVRRAFELFLKSAGMLFTSFETATDFLSVFKIKSGGQDVIVLDLNLPGLNGCDLLKQMDQDGIHVPVIVVTAFDDPVSRECCLKYGVKAYLRKPVDGEALIDIIKFNLPELKN
jgi:FixJ family two-component response regulator